MLEMAALEIVQYFSVCSLHVVAEVVAVNVSQIIAKGYVPSKSSTYPSKVGYVTLSRNQLGGTGFTGAVDG